MKQRALWTLGVCCLVGFTSSASAADATTTPAPPPSLNIHQATTPPKIDGAADAAYGDAATLEVAAFHDQPAAANLSAKRWLSWDAAALYINVAVTDDKLVDVKTKDDLAQGDGIQFWLGDFWFSAGPLSDGSVGLTASDVKSWSLPDLSGVKTALHKTDKGYDIELAIPAALFKAATHTDLAKGAVLPFALSVYDADTASPLARTTLSFPTTYGWNNVDSYAQATLD